ncbi:hypothetical protein WR25_05977 [Diploscapter pachys]|uniref:Arf-GAP domain-containing protein n=1 Tax=Diploscapter pachys TaxID=2018661 RepID=A0A2A2LQ84_9BILA|nr:hypothetical protein WR25_05977 [Diploscapter pachys]
MSNSKDNYDENQRIIANFMKEDANAICADCEAKQPRWASWNIGIFICMRCAGLHRNMGVQISRVKSVNLDRWKDEEVLRVLAMGNKKAKRIYEFDLPENFQRPKTDAAMEIFIRAKYEHKRYMDRAFDDKSLQNHVDSKIPGLEQIRSDRIRRWYLPSSSKSYEKCSTEDNSPGTNTKQSPPKGILKNTFEKKKQQNEDDEFGPMVSAPSMRKSKTINDGIHADLADLDPEAFRNPQQVSRNDTETMPKRSVSEILSLYNMSYAQQPQFTNQQFLTNNQRFVSIPQRQQSYQNHFNLVANSRDTFL